MRRLAGELPGDFAKIAAELIESANAKAESVATRKASQLALEAFAPAVPEMIGGSADLTHSNLTIWKGATTLKRGEAGRYISYGVREFGMAAIMNGLALHGGFIPFGGTFLTFTDYSRNAIRMAALMKLRVIHVLTHDSIGLGEDGPTHQAVEHVSSLRLIPDLEVWRPCDTVETAVAWKLALERRNGPTALILSRQNLPFVLRDDAGIAAIELGGYVVSDPDGPLHRIVIATGSEVGLALAVQKKLADEGIGVRVVSMPSTTTFDRQPAEYRDDVLPSRRSEDRARSRRERALVEIRARRRLRDRHRPLRRIGARRAAVRVFRIHAGARRRRRATRHRGCLMFPLSRLRERAGVRALLVRPIARASLIRLPAPSPASGRRDHTELPIERPPPWPSSPSSNSSTTPPNTRYGLPAFNVNNMEQIQAIMQAADEVDSPVILQASAGARSYAGEAIPAPSRARRGRAISRRFRCACIRITARARPSARHRSAPASRA